MLNNPLLYNDLLGDTAKIGPITPDQIGKHKKADVIDQLINQWSKLTGLKLSIDADGKLINGGVVTDKGISKTARKDILDLIGPGGTVYIDFTSVSASRSSNADDGSNNSFITMNVDRIDAQVAGTSKDLNKMTVGMGMSVLHEMGHTFLNGKVLHGDAEIKQFGVIGTIDQRMNQIRKEMGADWGQRLSYTYLNVDGYNYTPMNAASLKAMQNVLPAIMNGNTQNIRMPSTGVIKQKSSIMGQTLGYE